MISERSFNGRRFVLAIVTVYAFVYLYEWGLHGWLLADQYRQSQDLWRSPETMQAYILWLLAGYFIFTLFFAVIYLRFRRSGRMSEGAYYGLLVGLLFCATNIIFYAVQPLPLSLIIYWCAGVLIEGLFAGILMAAVYKDRELFA